MSLDSLLENATPIVATMLTSAVKGSVIVLIAAAGAWALRLRPAAVRHAIWVAAIASQLLLPVLGALIPARAIEVPTQRAAFTKLVRAFEVMTPASADSRPAAASARARTALDEQSAVRSPQSTPLPFTWIELAIVLWSLGALFVLVRFALGTLAVWRDTHRERKPCDPRWIVQAGFIQEELGMTREASLVCGTKLSVPYAWGLLKPVVCLPAEAATWSEERLRIVLLHELSHVARWDAVSELLAQIVLIVFWFNPFVWLAVRQMRIEREHACDDRVLSGGVKPSNYVEELLEMIRKIGEGGNAPAFGAIAMARRTQFESRMLAVLNPRIDHGVSSRRTIGAVAGVSLVLAMSLASVRPAVAADRVQGATFASDTARKLIGFLGGDTITPRQTGFEEAIEQCERRKPKRKPAIMFCETREFVFDAKDGEVSFEDNHVSGVIFTTSSSRRNVAVRALVHGQGDTMEEARDQASRVKLTVGPRMRHEAGPGDNRNMWWVLYEVTVPAGTAVRARTENGRIALSYFRGRADIETTNGPLQLNDVAGHITGGTQNGPIYVELSGKKWDGEGLDLRSQNGPIDLMIPDDYSAHLITGTQNGPMEMQRSMNIRRLTGKRIVADVGAGGTTVRVTTENGPATIH